MNPANNTKIAAQVRIPRKSRGFTLLELMIVVVIISILAGIGYPMYLDQIRKSRRATAQTALNDAAARMEQFFLDRKSYADDMNQLGYDVAAAAPLRTDEGFYDVSVDAPTAACPISTCYALTATAVGVQTDDTVCLTITLNSRGVKDPAACW